MTPKDALRAARALVEGKYATGRLEGPLEASQVSTILIQWSDVDGAWIASLVNAERPIKLGRINADGSTPSKALRNLDELLAIHAE